MKVTVVTLIIRALVMDLKSIQKRLEEVKITSKVGTIYKIPLLKTANILRMEQGY